jgi:hypothetical protein
MDLENLTEEEFMAMSEDDRMALLDGGEASPSPVVPESPGADNPAGAPEGAQPAAQPLAEAQTPADSQAYPDQRQGDPTVALRQERERRRQAEAAAQQLAQQYQQAQRVLTDPNALHEHLRAIGMLEEESPGLAYENPEAIQAMIAQAVGPLQQTIQMYEQERQMYAQQQQAQAFAQQFPDAPALIQQFDAAFPHLAGEYNLQEKYFLANGMRAAGPQGQAQQAAQTEAQAREMATQMAAQALGGVKGKQTPVTLTGVTPSRETEAALDVDAMGEDDWERLSPEARKKALGGY